MWLCLWQSAALPFWDENDASIFGSRLGFEIAQMVLHRTSESGVAEVMEFRIWVEELSLVLRVIATRTSLFGGGVHGTVHPGMHEAWSVHSIQYIYYIPL